MGTNYLRFVLKIMLAAFLLVLPAQQYAKAQSQPLSENNEYPYQVYLPLLFNGEREPVGGGISPLVEFIQTVTDGTGNLTGVYFPDILASPVVQQPESDPSYISFQPDVLTQYALPAQLGVTALLAHNHLAGAKFFDLQPGQQIILVYGTGETKTYQVEGIYQYQAEEPAQATSALVDLQTGERLTAAEVFARHYMQTGQLVFQTCIARDGIATWGRIFIQAQPVE